MLKSLRESEIDFIDFIFGGPFNLSPGQFTDDSEMGLAIMSVLNEKGYYDVEAVAKSYHQWYDSGPYDIGNATSAAVSKSSASKMKFIANTTNKTSLSNGFLMRLPFLISFYYNKDPRELLNAIDEDVQLTHGHNEAKIIASIYGMMLFRAINGVTADEIYKWGHKKSENSTLFKEIYRAVENNTNYFDYDGKVFYFQDIDSKFCGFVGFAIWLLLLCLKQHTSYKDAILEVVSFGGDTDSNSTIIGAVMGALYPHTIPKEWINSVLTYKDAKRFNKYPIADPKVWMKWMPV